MALDNKKELNLSEWYLELVQSAELMDYAPIQGCMVIRERGYAMWEKIQGFLDARFKAGGVRNTYFPLFIPESLLEKEAEHFEGFKPEVAWVTHGGDTPLGERLALRPTSETIMYSMFSKWIDSHRDLPFKINQWCNIIRWDTKAVKPFLRTREFLWQEGHTAHASREEAEEMTLQALEWYRQLCEELLAMPALLGKKTDAERFPGAEYTTTIESLMPDGKALQGGTSHLLGQNFAKIFNIKFKTEDEKEELVWQTSWGVSTRLIGAVAMLHGDDHGLVLPPRLAPLQVVIVPIYDNEEDKRMVLVACRKTEEKIKGAGLTVLLDDREDKTPGYKFNDWELKGVPVRVETGVKDLAQEGVTVARRDTLKKDFVPDDKVVSVVTGLMEKIQKNLFERAKTFLEANTFSTENFEQFKGVIEQKKGFVEAQWCGDPRCEEAIKEETGATIRLIPFKEEPGGKCVYCGKPGKTKAVFARSY